MTRFDDLLCCLASGDAESALMVWRSGGWTDTDRAKAKRLLAAARAMAIEVLP